MAESWQKILDDFSGSKSSSSSKSSTSSKTSTTSSASKKKKKDWQNILDDFSGGGKLTAKTPYKSTVAERVKARAKAKKLEEEKKKKEEPSWFRKGLFEDGYDFGDITKTILGTGADVLEDLGAGIAEMPERIADAAATIAPYFAKSQLNQAAYSTMDKNLLKAANEYDLKEEKKKADEFVKKDLYDGKAVAHSILNPVTDAASAMIGQEYEGASVLGEKADSTVQSGGQLLATAGLQAVGVPWFLTTGVTAYGAEAENALNQGATHEEAMGSAAISAAAEILTEKLSGGIKFGGKAWDDALSKQFARKISNKLGRYAARLGVDFTGEAAEEVLSQVASNIGSSLYRDESMQQILFSEEAFDEYLDAAIGGGLLGGVSGGFKAVNSTRKGVDYVTELTKNEQKVVDKVYKDRVAEKEKKGKVTEKQKSEIYDKVLSDMDKGYITTDEIESALGGGTYNLYKNTIDTEDAQIKELETQIKELDDAANTLGNANKQAELKTKLDELKKNSKRTELKTQLDEEVFNLVKGDRLAETYNERARRGEAYQADLTKYDAKQQAVIQKAIDSGILNNSNRTHDFVDMVAKISADKGVLFDFTNNQKLKDSGFAVEGKQVNGYVTKGGITLNIDSKKAMETTVGHEITHVLEGTEFYDSLKQTIFEYAKTKGEYQTRFDSLTELYKDIEDADIEGELTADLVGEYLFSDTDFINNLSTKNRNVFQKIYDEIKYLCKVATAGSKEARELERVRKAFEDAYRAGGKAQSETKYSISVSKSASDVISSLYNYDTVKVDKAVVDFNTEEFESKWDKGYYTSVVDTISKQTGKSKQEVWDAFSGLLMKNEGIAKVDGKTYINVHELSEDNLRKAFELGGLASPSIGIVDVDSPNTNFGNISLIFPDIFNPDTVPTFYGDSYSSSLPAVAKFTDRTTLVDALTYGFEGMEYADILSNEEISDLLEDLEQIYFYDERQRTSHSISRDGFRNAQEFARSYDVKSIPGLLKLYNGLKENFDSYEHFLADFANKAFTNNKIHKDNTGNPFYDWDNRRYQFRDYTLDDAVEEMTAKGEEDFKFATGERVPDYSELLTDGMRARLKAGSTSYYEAKPQRAVYIDEATYAVVPESTSSDVIEMLEADGVEVVKYQNKGGYDGIAKGKAEAIKGILERDTTGIRYSLSDSNGRQLTKEQQSLAEDQSVKVLDGGSVAKYSLSTWTPEMQTKVSENLVKAGFEKSDVDKWIQDTNSIAAVIASDKERLDFEAHENHTMVKDNLDYYKTVEASTLCAKRLKYQGTFDAIQHRLPNTTLTSDMLIELREMMKKNGHEVPCGACYVESRRRHLGKYATDWLKTYDAEYIPTLADVTTTDGLEKLRTEHPQTYKDFVDAMKKKGVSNPKVVELRTEYRGEIMKISDAVYKKIMKIGGLRLQSFSDFETPHLLDMMQVVNDMASRKFVSQAYTKVPNFAWVLGDTNIKINLSLIPGDTGVDANGELIFDPKEGMPIEDAMQLRDRYSKNVGTTIIGINDEHILKCMADDRIDYIIPFHRSGWGAKELSAMGLDSYVDYTAQQKERDIKTGKGVPNIDEMSYWDFSKSGKENAEAYLALCAEKGVIPKFDKFLVNNGNGSYSLQPDGSTDGYWKTLINFKMYDNDGVGSPHQAVVPNFNMEEAYRVLNEYEGGANSLPVANDVVEEFVAKYKADVAPVRSLSAEGETPVRPNYRATMGEDIALQGIAPVTENSTVEQETQLTEDNSTLSEEETVAPLPDSGEEVKQTRKQYHQSIIDRIRDTFKARGFDFDEVLKKAKNLSTWSTVDNTPQRVMEKSLGYKEGGILADITVNKVAQNETEGIKWVNENVKLLKQISKEYHIKPGSKESAAAQMYAEGFYVNKNNDIVRYGDPELIQDFKNPEVRRNIKALAGDPRIRKIYDDTLASINESRTRNLYPEIPRLDNYFLHFRAMNDTFSTLGLPFNPNDIRAKDLPTDLNGVTADLKPGQPYFASAMHRTGKRTSFDMLGGIERYLNSAKNQIYHIDDIQTLRALRNHIAETYGQATGLEDLDSLTDAEAEERIKQVYGSHLSTFAKFLNEEANVLAGKTALIDRGIEGIIGRRGITFLNTLNGQVGSNMVGYNISSSLTNFLPVAQTFAKTNKADFVKAFAQTVANKFSGGRLDTFSDDSPVVIRRKGQDNFYQTPWQRVKNPGYVLMGAVDDISTELIARTKYNEFIRKGMDSQKAHFETDKWVSKLMGDRSLGQQPQLYNSKMLGLVTKFQLEVRNQLDAQFYDTIQETKVSNEQIQNGLLRNAKTAAKVTSTFVQLAVAQHLFGKAFESVAGYNPAFDIIEVLMTAFGFDDEEDSEDTVLDNLEQGFLELLEDMPYASTFLDGGRIPISEAMPIDELVKGKDQYGNEKSRWETVGEVAPYYLMPAGYGQLKKSVAGLKMFSDEHPIAGSYTDAGNLRFPVEDTLGNRAKAAVFGQYASETARKYFDGEQRTLNHDQTEIFAELDMPIEEYWEYRDNLNKFYDVKDKLKEAADADNATEADILKGKYITAVNSDLYDLYDKQKELAKGNSLTKKSQIQSIQNQMANLIADSQRDIDNIYVNGYYATIGDKRFDYSDYNGKWYEISGEYLEKEQKAIERYGVTPDYYWNNTDQFYHADYYFKYNPELEDVSKNVFDGEWFAGYAAHVSQIKGDDFNNDGKTDSGSKKKKVFAYIDGLDVSDHEKYILKRMSYTSERTHSYDIVEYVSNRSDLSYDQKMAVLEGLGYTLDDEGYVLDKGKYIER